MSFHNLNSIYDIDNYIKNGDNVKQSWTGNRLKPPALLLFQTAEELYRKKK